MKVPQEGNPLPVNHAQQPTDVLALRTQHGIEPVARFPLEVTALHAVVCRRCQMMGSIAWRRLSSWRSLAFTDTQSFELAPVLDGDTGFVNIYPALAQALQVAPNGARTWVMRVMAGGGLEAGVRKIDPSPDCAPDLRGMLARKKLQMKVSLNTSSGPFVHGNQLRRRPKDCDLLRSSYQ